MPTCRAIRGARARRPCARVCTFGITSLNAVGTEPPFSFTTLASESQASASIIVGNACAAAGHEALSRAATSASSASAHAAVAAICTNECLSLRIARADAVENLALFVEDGDHLEECSIPLEQLRGAASRRMSIVIANVPRCVVDVWLLHRLMAISTGASAFAGTPAAIGRPTIIASIMAAPESLLIFL